MDTQSTAAIGAQPYSDEPRRGLFWRLLKGALPLVVIGLAVYLVFNFPALWTRLTFMISSPAVSDAKTLPETIRSGGGPNPAAAGGEPAPCSGNIPYDDSGKPRAICNDYVYIPRIRVAAPIVRPRSTAETVVNDALLKGVVKYPGTAEPGQRGNVFLTGHSSYYWWVNTPYRNVFALVPQLRQGDQIIVYRGNRKYVYKVRSIYEIDPSQTGVLKPTAVPTVTLSTCVPVGTSYRRKIVQATQVTPNPATARSTSGQAATPSRLPGIR